MLNFGTNARTFESVRHNNSSRSSNRTYLDVDEDSLSCMVSNCSDFRNWPSYSPSFRQDHRNVGIESAVNGFSQVKKADSPNASDIFPYGNDASISPKEASSISEKPSFARGYKQSNPFSSIPGGMFPPPTMDTAEYSTSLLIDNVQVEIELDAPDRHRLSLNATHGLLGSPDTSSAASLPRPNSAIQPFTRTNCPGYPASTSEVSILQSTAESTLSSPSNFASRMTSPRTPSQKHAFELQENGKDANTSTTRGDASPDSIKPTKTPFSLISRFKSPLKPIRAFAMQLHDDSDKDKCGEIKQGANTASSTPLPASRATSSSSPEESPLEPREPLMTTTAALPPASFIRIPSASKFFDGPMTGSDRDPNDPLVPFGPHSAFPMPREESVKTPSPFQPLFIDSTRSPTDDMNSPAGDVKPDVHRLKGELSTSMGHSEASSTATSAAVPIFDMQMSFVRMRLASDHSVDLTLPSPRTDEEGLLDTEEGLLDSKEEMDESYSPDTTCLVREREADSEARIAPAELMNYNTTATNRICMSDANCDVHAQTNMVAVGHVAGGVILSGMKVDTAEHAAGAQIEQGIPASAQQSKTDPMQSHLPLYRSLSHELLALSMYDEQSIDSSLDSSLISSHRAVSAPPFASEASKTLPVVSGVCSEPPVSPGVDAAESTAFASASPKPRQRDSAHQADADSPLVLSPTPLAPEHSFQPIASSEQTLPSSHSPTVLVVPRSNRLSLEASDFAGLPGISGVAASTAHTVCTAPGCEGMPSPSSPIVTLLSPVTPDTLSSAQLASPYPFGVSTAFSHLSVVFAQPQSAESNDSTESNTATGEQAILAVSMEKSREVSRGQDASSALAASSTLVMDNPIVESNNALHSGSVPDHADITAPMALEIQCGEFKSSSYKGHNAASTMQTLEPYVSSSNTSPPNVAIHASFDAAASPPSLVPDAAFWNRVDVLHGSSTAAVPPSISGIPPPKPTAAAAASAMATARTTRKRRISPLHASPPSLVVPVPRIPIPAPIPLDARESNRSNFSHEPSLVFSPPKFATVAPQGVFRPASTMILSPKQAPFLRATTSSPNNAHSRSKSTLLSPIQRPHTSPKHSADSPTLSPSQVSSIHSSSYSSAGASTIATTSSATTSPSSFNFHPTHALMSSTASSSTHSNAPSTTASPTPSPALKRMHSLSKFQSVSVRARLNRPLEFASPDATDTDSPKLPSTTTTTTAVTTSAYLSAPTTLPLGARSQQTPPPWRPSGPVFKPLSLSALPFRNALLASNSSSSSSATVSAKTSRFTYAQSRSSFLRKSSERALQRDSSNTAASTPVATPGSAGMVIGTGIGNFVGAHELRKVASAGSAMFPSSSSVPSQYWDGDKAFLRFRNDGRPVSPLSISSRESAFTTYLRQGKQAAASASSRKPQGGSIPTLSSSPTASIPSVLPDLLAPRFSLTPVTPVSVCPSPNTTSGFGPDVPTSYTFYSPRFAYASASVGDANTMSPADSTISTPGGHSGSIQGHAASAAVVVSPYRAPAFNLSAAIELESKRMRSNQQGDPHRESTKDVTSGAPVVSLSTGGSTPAVASGFATPATANATSPISGPLLSPGLPTTTMFVGSPGSAFRKTPRTTPLS